MPTAKSDGISRVLLLSLPVGSWVHAYAASVLDGSPVCVQSLAAPDS